jgi:hypothetical protein
VAERVLAAQRWGAWPVCSRQAGASSQRRRASQAYPKTADLLKPQPVANPDAATAQKPSTGDADGPAGVA